VFVRFVVSFPLFKIASTADQLRDLVDRDQKLRNEFAKEMESAGGWSQALLDKFIADHGTTPDDVFGSASVERDLMTLMPTLDFSSFSEDNWNDFWLLSQHMDNHPDFQRSALHSIKEHRGHESEEYKMLLWRIAGNIEGTHGTVPFDLSKINESEIDWQHLESIVG